MEGTLPIFSLLTLPKKQYILIAIFWGNKAILLKNEGAYIHTVSQAKLDYEVVYSIALREKLIFTVDRDFVMRLELV